MKLRQKTTAVLLIAIFMISIFAMQAYAIEGTHLVAAGTAGTEDRIVLDMPTGFKLGDLNSIAWSEWLVAGYPPHVDVILDLNVDGSYGPEDDALVFEYAYNDVSHALTEAPMPYGALTGAWYQTFSDDGNGPAAITDTSMAWATKGAPGPLGGGFGANNFFFLNLAQWKAGVTYTASGQNQKTISSDSIVLRLEIEIDNWVVNSEAYVDNIVVDHDFVAPVVRPRTGGPTYFDGVTMGTLCITPHKLIVASFRGLPVNGSCYVTVTILTEEGDIFYTSRTFHVRARAATMCLYLHELMFPDNYSVVVSSSFGELPYLVASRAGIERRFGY